MTSWHALARRRKSELSSTSKLDTPHEGSSLSLSSFIIVVCHLQILISNWSCVSWPIIPTPFNLINKTQIMINTFIMYIVSTVTQTCIIICRKLKIFLIFGPFHSFSFWTRDEKEAGSSFWQFSSSSSSITTYGIRFNCAFVCLTFFNLHIFLSHLHNHTFGRRKGYIKLY